MQKLLCFSARGLVRLNRFCYAAETRPKIPENWELSLQSRFEMGNALLGAYSTQQFAYLLKDNFQYVNDYYIAYAMQRIVELNLELDHHFYNTMVPVLIDYVSRFTRDHNRSLGQIIACSGFANVQDDKLWQLYEQKLIKERLYRYVPLENLVELVQGVAQSSYGSPELFNTLEKVFIRHRLALTPENRQICFEAFQKKHQGSPIFYKLLEDPSTDYEAALRTEQKQIGS